MKKYANKTIDLEVLANIFFCTLYYDLRLEVRRLSSYSYKSLKMKGFFCHITNIGKLLNPKCIVSTCVYLLQYSTVQYITDINTLYLWMEGQYTSTSSQYDKHKLNTISFNN